MSEIFGGVVFCLIVLGVARLLIWIIEKIIGEQDPLRLVLPIITILFAIFVSSAEKEYLVAGIILTIAGIVWLVYNLMENMLMDFLDALPFAVIAVGVFILMASLAQGSVPGVVWGSIITIAGIAWPVVGSILKKQTQKLEEQKRREWEAETERLKQSAQQGDVAAQYQLGERYRSRGDLEEGKKWLKMSAGNGHEEAKRILTDIAAKEAAEKKAAEEYKAKQKAKEADEKMVWQRIRQQLRSEGKKCLTCYEWSGNNIVTAPNNRIMASGFKIRYNFELVRGKTGECHSKHGNTFSSSSGDGCPFWVEHPSITDDNYW
ncbi:hypothetical protein FACS189473_0080 [Spirochaetia bacterium]|nr:hypothetical protein FACS189473_0080 [Spirochaetia bacterium]